MEEGSKVAAAAKAAAVDVDEYGTGRSGADISGSKLWKQYKTSDRKSRKSINRGGSSDGIHPQVLNMEREDRTQPTSQEEAVVNMITETDSINKEGGKQQQKEKSGDEVKKEGDTISDSTSSNIETTKNTEMDIINCPGYSLLCQSEVGLCQRLSLLPEHYLEAKKNLIHESLTQGLLDNGSINSHRTVVIDVEKRENIVEFILRAGWISNKVKSEQLKPSKDKIDTSA